MKACSLCGENAAIWGRNYPCHPVPTPALEKSTDEELKRSARERGLAPGDIVRNDSGHVAIVTYANDKWGDIRVRLRGKYAEEYPSHAIGWHVIKKASPEQAKRWLESDKERTKDHVPFKRTFRVDPVTQATIYIHDEDEFGYRSFNKDRGNDERTAS